MTINAYKLEWKKEDPATPALIDPMLSEMGLAEDGDPLKVEARDVTREAVIADIEIGGGTLTMGTVESMASDFYEGYLTALRKHQAVPAAV